MPSVVCGSYPPIWATSMSVTHFGTCQGAPSSWNKRLGGWKNAGRRGHETTAQLPRAAGELLHPTPDGSTAGQPTHYRFLSGHLPLAAELAQKQRHKPPSSLELSDIDAPLVCAFLDDLEKHRGSKASSRNVRLTAIRSFFRYAAFQEPSQSEYIQRVLAVPSKRQPRPMVNFLLREEI